MNVAASGHRHRRLGLRGKLVLCAAFAAVSLLFAEAALRLLMPRGVLLSPTAIEVFAERAKVESEMLRADPEFGHVPVLDGKAYDRFGLLRGWGTRSGTADRGPDVTRFLFLGDSVTRRATVLEPLRELWRGPAAEFLNAGVESWNPIQEIEGYFRHQQALQPDHVVLSLHHNDLSESTVALLHEGRFTLCNPGSLVDCSPTWYGRSMLYQLYVQARHTDRLRPKHYTFRAAEVEAALVRLRDDLRQRGKQLTILHLPVFSALAAAPEHERRSRTMQTEMLQRLGVAAIDLQPVVEEMVKFGLPVRATPTDVHHPDRLCGELMAQQAAATMFAAPSVGATATPRHVVAGSDQTIEIDAGPAAAGRRFVVLGSRSGMTPVTTLPQGRVALAPDDHLLRTVASPVAGTLDAAGRASCRLGTPAGAAGAVTFHVVAVYDAAGARFEHLGWPMAMFVAPQ